MSSVFLKYWLPSLLALGIITGTIMTETAYISDGSDGKERRTYIATGRIVRDVSATLFAAYVVLGVSRGLGPN